MCPFWHLTPSYYSYLVGLKIKALAVKVYLTCKMTFVLNNFDVTGMIFHLYRTKTGQKKLQNVLNKDLYVILHHS